MDDILRFLLKGVLFESLKKLTEDNNTIGGSVRIDKCRLVPTNLEDSIRLDIAGVSYRVDVTIERTTQR